MNQSKIKIVYIITSLGFGGAERPLLDLVKFINRSKLNISVATVVGGGPLEQEFKNLGVEVKVFKKKTKLGLETISSLKKYLEEKKPDIVHTHLFAGDFWGKVAARKAKVPIIVSTEQNLNLDEGWIKGLIKTKTYRFTNRVITISKAIKDYTVKAYKVNPEKIEVIYSGIDLDKFSYQPKDLGLEPKLGIIGRLEKQKGHKYLLKALVNVLKDFPQAQLWIIGEGSLHSQLERQARQLKIDKNVKFLGARKNIPEILAGLDIFVMPSLWEGLGVAAIEAQACGVPVIASKVDGLKEVVEDKKTGLLVEPKNSRALAEAIIWSLKHPKIVKQVIINARRSVEEKFDIKKMVSKYEALYQKLYESTPGK